MSYIGKIKDSYVKTNIINIYAHVNIEGRLFYVLYENYEVLYNVDYSFLSKISFILPIHPLVGVKIVKGSE